MEEKRILVPIVGQGSIIHIIRTGMLDRMSGFCKPVVALLWKQEDLIKELEGKGYEVTIFPEYKLSATYESLRYKINLWYREYKVKTPSISLQRKYLEQFGNVDKGIKLKRKLREGYHHLRFKLQPAYIQHLLRAEELMMHKEEGYTKFKKWVNELAVDGLFTVTPFLPEVDLIARILKEQKIPVISSIHSFDNVTKRGWQSVIFDQYIVWNKYNKAELERIYPSLKKDDSITIAGAPQFDFHFSPQFVWDREEWLRRLGLPTDKRIILYSGGPVSLLPDEPQYLQALNDAFKNGEISTDYIVLFRCHPLDKKERWIKYVGESPFIIYDNAPSGSKKLDQVNVEYDDIRKLMSTLKHTDIHINVVSTMCVDGSVFKKPQIGPYYDEVHPDKQELFRGMYHQEHYRPILKSNVLNLANTRQEFIDVVKQALKDPQSYTKNCETCVHEIITYTDGASTERAVNAIHKFFKG